MNQPDPVQKGCHRCHLLQWHQAPRDLGTVASENDGCELNHPQVLGVRHCVSHHMYYTYVLHISIYMYI